MGTEGLLPSRPAKKGQLLTLLAGASRKHFALATTATISNASRRRRVRIFDLYQRASGDDCDLLEARAHVAAASGSDLSVDASLVSATYGAILKCLGASRT